MISPPTAALIERLLATGCAVAEDYFAPALCQALQLEAEALTADETAIDAGVGRGVDHKSDAAIRRARIRWLDGRSPAQLDFTGRAEDLRISINELFYLGLFDFDAQLALTPVGGFYARHSDSFQGARNRIVSLVAYLNDGWQSADGGCLRIWPLDGARIDVVPRRGTLVLMLSENVEHEVLPTNRSRASIAGWFRLRA